MSPKLLPLSILVLKRSIHIKWKFTSKGFTQTLVVFNLLLSSCLYLKKKICRHHLFAMVPRKINHSIGTLPACYINDSTLCLSFIIFSRVKGNSLKHILIYNVIIWVKRHLITELICSVVRVCWKSAIRLAGIFKTSHKPV